MEIEHREFVRERFPVWYQHHGDRVEVLDVKDEYGYRDPQLERLLCDRVERVLRGRGLIG